MSKINRKILVFDIEANGFYEDVTKIHCAVFRNLKGEVVKTFTPETIKDLPSFMATCHVLIGHWIVGYDLPVIEKVLGFKYEGVAVDTLLMSRLLKPKRILPPNALDRRAGAHTLYAWGVRVGVDKPEHSDWENYSEEMLHRCIEDTAINVKVYHLLMKEAGKDTWNDAFKLSFKLFELLQKQERYGWKVDRQYMEFCIRLLSRTVDRIDKIVTPNLPFVLDIQESKLKGVITYVKKPFLKSGLYNHHVVAYFGEDNPQILNREIGGPFSRITFRQVDLNSNMETKEYLLNLGWEPLEWNTNDEGAQTSPKLSKDDPYEGISGVLGRLIARRVQCRQRRSIITGLIGLIRPDGAIASKVTSLAETSRAIHGGIVNIPKATSFFGKQMRKMFVAREGKVLVSTDSDSCQLRMLGGRMGDPAYITAIETGDKAKETDLHSLTKKIVDAESRDISKNIIYCLLFGGGDTKLGKTAKMPGQGALIRSKLYKGFDGLEALMEGLTKEWKASAKKRWNTKFNRMEYYDGYITGLDGRPVKVAFEHQLLVYLLQSDEAIMMTAAYIKAFTEMSKRWEWGKKWALICFYHDEFTVECDPDIAQEVAKISADAITWAGKHFNIQCPHKGDPAIGNNWYSVH